MLRFVIIGPFILGVLSTLEDLLCLLFYNYLWSAYNFFSVDCKLCSSYSICMSFWKVIEFNSFLLHLRIYFASSTKCSFIVETPTKRVGLSLAPSTNAEKLFIYRSNSFITFLLFFLASRSCPLISLIFLANLTYISLLFANYLV